MKASVYDITVNNQPKLLCEVVFKYDVPVIEDNIYFNNETYMVVRREFSISNESWHSKHYTNNDVIIYVRQVTSNYKNGLKTNNGINY